MSPTNIFAPVSTPADSIFGLSIFVLLNVAAIFIVVFALLAYVVVRFRNKRNDDRKEPAQIYGSTQVELAWTVIPVLIVLALFLASERSNHISGKLIHVNDDWKKLRDSNMHPEAYTLRRVLKV